MRASFLLACGAALMATAAQAADGSGLAGVWSPEKREERLVPVDGRPVPLTAEGQRRYDENKAVLAGMATGPVDRNDLRRCLPLGPTRIVEELFPVQIVETKTDVILIWEHNHAYETVYLNQKPDPEADWAYMGNSTGVRTKTGLTVATQGFNDQTFLDNSGLPHTENLKLTRKLQLSPDGQKLEIVSTIVDPEIYSRPWMVRHELTRRPGEVLREYVCGQGPTLETRYNPAG